MLRIVENRKKFLFISGGIFLVGIIVLIIYAAAGKGALNYDLEFTGGTQLNLDIGKEYNNKDIEKVVQDNVGGVSVQIQKVIGSNEVIIKSRLLTADERNKVYDALLTKYSITTQNALSFSDYSATISSDMQKNAIISVILASVMMLIYISIRFRDFKLGSAAILALLHDIGIVLVVYIVLRIPINNSFIAAILTILGFSINATIVIFDRVRENKKRMKRSDVAGLVNVSITQTLNRSIYTSLTTFVAITTVYIFGVDSIRQFALPIMIGVLGGTYSSICISGSLWYTFVRKNYEKDATGKAKVSAN